MCVPNYQVTSLDPLRKFLKNTRYYLNVKENDGLNAVNSIIHNDQEMIRQYLWNFLIRSTCNGRQIYEVNYV